MTKMVKLQAPEGFTDVSFGSQSYEVDENGVVEVPAEAAQFLYQFGFGNVVEETAETEQPVEAEEPEKGKRGRKAKAEHPAEQPAEQAEAEQTDEAEKAE
jgi:hypothetical protein